MPATGAHVDVLIADLSSQMDMRWLAGDVLQTYPQIDVLINNVGCTGNAARCR